MGILPPESTTLVAPAIGADDVNPQVSDTDGVPATCMPVGNDRVSAADVRLFELVLAKVMLRVLTSPPLIVAGVNCGVTVTVADAHNGTKANSKLSTPLR